MDNHILNKLKERLGEERVKENFILAPYTTFKMGGPAQYYFEALSDEDLIAAVKSAYEWKLDLTVLGGASNVIVSDKGVRGLVVRNQYVDQKPIEETDNFVLLQVSSGYSVTRLAKETAQKGWSGFEYHLGLPGTMGGAICMNAKWTNPHSYIGDNLIKACLVNRRGNVRTVDTSYFNFSYGKSILQETGDIVIWAVFKLEKKDPKLLLKCAQNALDYRKQTQPYGVATSGCFFWNAKGEPAGKLIDQLGLKGYRVGDLEVSDKHANFVINKGKGTEKDFRRLIATIKKKVRQKYEV